MKRVFTSALAGMIVLAAGVVAANANWGNTIALAVIGNDLYTVEKSGALYRTNLSSGRWVQIGKSEFENTRFMFASTSTLFTIEREELARHLGVLRKKLKPEAAVWVSWPKKASKVQSNVTEHVIREVALPLGFVDVKVCAVSEVWSGLKLVVRKALRTENAA